MNTLIHGMPEYEAVKQEILSKWSVTPTENFKVKEAIRGRIDYLKDSLRKTGQKGYVLGISGGVDSSTVGRLAQIAVEELRAEGYDAKFIAMRLPAGVQFDEDDAQKALQFIKPDMTLTVNVGEASRATSNQVISELAKNGITVSASQEDYHLGNVKSRNRMLAIYEVCGITGTIQLGTDHNFELVMAFFGKFADSAVDITVLSGNKKMGVNKRQVRLIAKELGAPESVYSKPATADLEELVEGKLDHVGMGISSDDVLDDFLENKYCPPVDEEVIVNTYHKTRHKRDPIPMYSD